MRDNCVIFTTPERQELRVVFDPDGTPFFCGPDLAAIAGYEQPRKAVTGGKDVYKRQIIYYPMSMLIATGIC